MVLQWPNFSSTTYTGVAAPEKKTDFTLTKKHERQIWFDFAPEHRVPTRGHVSLLPDTDSNVPRPPFWPMRLSLSDVSSQEGFWGQVTGSAGTNYLAFEPIPLNAGKPCLSYFLSKFSFNTTFSKTNLNRRSSFHSHSSFFNIFSVPEFDL